MKQKATLHGNSHMGTKIQLLSITPGSVIYEVKIKFLNS